MHSSPPQFEPPANKVAPPSGQSSNITKKKARKASKARTEKSSRDKLPSGSSTNEVGRGEMPKKSSSVESGSAEGSVKEEEIVVRKSSLPVEDDIRKLEDTVEIINRRQTTEVECKVDSKVREVHCVTCSEFLIITSLHIII